MVNDLTIIIEYTPLLQLFLLYLLLYYKDLGRFLHPRVRKERSALSDWYDVLTDLKLISSSPSPSLTAADIDGHSSTTRKKIYLSFTAPVLLSCLTDFFGAWYVLVICQTVSAFLLIVMFSRYYLGGTASYFSMRSTKLEEGKAGSRSRHLSGK